MQPERWQSCTDVFNAAVEQSPNERAAFLQRTCDGDEPLRRKVELLLKYHDASGDFIKSPAFQVAPELLAGDPETLIGQHLGCYRVDAVVGIGGMGVVYLAWDERLSRKVALKLLPQSMVASETDLERLKREARTASALNHPNIVTIHDIGEVDSTHYVATEFIEGITLRERITNGPIPPNEAVGIAAQVASALSVAHRAGIVHRDIKPENIMLRPDGYVKVLDFGIAKLTQQETLAAATVLDARSVTQQSMVLGTTRYMSPEQAMAQQVDARSDLWSLGVVLYEMLAGRAPFDGETAMDVIGAIFDSAPQPLKFRARVVPPALQSVVDRSLRKDPAERYQTAEEMLSELRAIEQRADGITARRARWIAVPAIAAVLAGLALVYAWRGVRTGPARAPVVSEKSIAVLPFENLSKDEDNAFFAAGVQDEILTSLAKVADLKVISRTSVMKYESGTERNLREIAKTLGVSHVVEGNVQRAGDRVRVGAKLIDARTDTQLWAEHYDRDVADVFGIQTDIAQQIADQLRSKLSARERIAIAERPTADVIAYALYTEARALGWGKLGWGNWDGAEKTFTRKLKLLEQATQRDPNFALAYCALAQTEGDLYDQTGDRTHLELAKKAADIALRLRPDLGETHLELARYYFYANDFDRAREELTVARRTLPNDSEAIFMAARIDKRQNRWDAALANLQKASELDPRNTEIDYHLKRNYRQMRRYAECERRFPQESDPDPAQNLWVKLERAELKLDEGDPVAAQALLAQVPLNFSPTEEIWSIRFTTALYLRDYEAANRVIAAAPANLRDRVFGGAPPASLADGLIADLHGDKRKAQEVFATARKRVDATWADKPEDEEYLALIAKLDAALGRRDEAIVAAQRAADLVPIAKDSWLGPSLITNLALVYAWTGERDLAIKQLEIVARIPAGPSYGDLRFNPCWDSLRGDPRFEQIVASLAPKSLAAPTSLAPEKSIAVLPLENLSDEKDNAFFAAGIHDELLSNLSKVKDLKVISRTSVMQYKSGNPRNIREIGQQLGVAHVLEGSVQRTANRVKVSAQLIDARTDAHLWAQTYDRDVTDVFAIQTEIAQQIADQLQAKLSPVEKAAIAERPTADLVAYALYAEAKGIAWYDWEGVDRSLIRKVNLLEKAIQRDPNFALAYSCLADVQLDLFQHTPKGSDLSHLELAKKAAEAALRLRPDLGEAHLALGKYYYFANLETGDFDRVRDELVIARRTLPNDSEAICLGARVDKRQNRWDDSLANFRKAKELDPRNIEVAHYRRLTLLEMRRYHEWEQALTKDIASGAIKEPRTQLYLTQLKLAQGDPVAAQALLAQVPIEFSPFAWIWRIRFEAALYLRDYDGANQVIAATPAKFAHVHNGQPPESWADGQLARARGDKQKALAAFAAARKNLEATWGDKPKGAQYFAIIAGLDAGLDRKEDAIREAQRAVDLMPIAKDSYWGPQWVMNLALVYAWTGERDRALEELEKVATIPNGPSYGELRFNPCWDDLRGDKRFDKIVAAAKAASR